MSDNTSLPSLSKDLFFLGQWEEKKYIHVHCLYILFAEPNKMLFKCYSNFIQMLFLKMSDKVLMLEGI